MKIEEEHVKLLAEMAELLELEENFGHVPEFNGKRPFGNSMRPVVASDAAEVMWGERPDLIDEDGSTDDEEVDGILEWVRECTPVLKAILRSDRLHEFVGMEVD